MNPAPKEPSWCSCTDLLVLRARLLPLMLMEEVGWRESWMQFASSPARLLPAWGAAFVPSLVTPRMSSLSCPNPPAFECCARTAQGLVQSKAYVRLMLPALSFGFLLHPFHTLLLLSISDASSTSAWRGVVGSLWNPGICFSTVTP